MRIYSRFLFSFISCFSSAYVSAQNTSAADYYDQRKGAITSQGQLNGAPLGPSWRKRADEYQSDQQFVIARDFETGKGFQHDMKEAIFWYKKSAEQGNTFAQMSLARIFYEGKEVEKDLVVAANWYERAANSGVIDAQFNLALMYAQGEGRAQNYQAAASMYEKAAEHGLAKAQYNLALLFAYGQGVKVDLTKAYMWLLLAAKGDPSQEQAQKNLATLEPHLSPNQILAAKEMAETRQLIKAN